MEREFNDMKDVFKVLPTTQEEPSSVRQAIPEYI